ASNDPYGDYSGWDMIYFADDSIGYLWLSLPELPENVVTGNVELSLWYSQYQYDDEEGTDNGMDYTIRLYAATYPWHQQSNWNYISASEQENYGMSTTLVDSAVGENSATYIDFDVSYLVGSWYSNAPNYGFGIVCPNDGAAFYLCGSPYPPILTVVYQYVTADLQTGIYYIQNAKYRNYLQDDGSSVKLRQFSEIDDQKWQLVNLGNGYFEIRSTKSSGLMLTAGIGTADSQNAVTLQARSEALALRQQWRLSVGHSGVVIQSRASYQELYANYTLCLGVETEGSRYFRNSCMQSNLGVATDDEMWVLRVSPLSLTSWNAGSGASVGFWDSSPKLYYQNYSYTNDNFYMLSSVGCALDQWNAVLPISVSITTNEDDAQILCYGGDEATLIGLGANIDSSTGGLTSYSIDSSFAVNVKWGATNKTTKKLTNARVYLVDRNLTANQQKNIATHEIGHALGYYGHSMRTADVMHANNKSEYTLTDREIAHLLQVYEIFYLKEE
ncbi:MAG: RICIN domain-containing protein, partial [Clostridia bacterium]|nr:RICIN domain-containing protein [Clostridia bacterium]